MASEDEKIFGEHFAHDRRFRFSYLRSLALLARYRGEIEQAIEYLREAEKIAEAIELPAELWSMKAEVGELYLAQGKEELAARTFNQAAVIVRKLSGDLEYESQRRIFLEEPKAHRTLESSSS